jgi:TRAP-type C4-dicarboxylate transport system permease small subunit
MSKLLDTIGKIFVFLAMASSFIMVCLTTADAVGRYLLNWPVPGAYEISEKYLMVFCVFLAVSFAYREGANIRLTFLVSRLPSRVRLFVNYFVQILSILLIMTLFFSATITNLNRMGNIVELGQKLTVPLWPAYLVISAGLLFMSLLMVLDLWRVKKGKSSLFKEDSTEESPPV